MRRVSPEARSWFFAALVAAGCGDPTKREPPTEDAPVRAEPAALEPTPGEPAPPPRLEPGHASRADASVVSEQVKPRPAPHQEGEVGGIFKKTEEPVPRYVKGLLESNFHDAGTHSRRDSAFSRRPRSSLNAAFRIPSGVALG